jgi:hypothetical protein
MELDPITGAVIRTVVTFNADGKGLAVDPLSGDLFVSLPFDGIKRILNYSSGMATLVPYASGDIDGFTFAVDGTIYGASGGGAVARITGTNSVTPGVVTILTYLNYPDGIGIEPNPADATKPFLYVNRNDGIITRIDTSAITTPPMSPCGNACTDIYTGGSRGDFVTVGPDGCLYATQSERVIKLTKADGTCGLTTVSQAPQIVLTPRNVTPSPAQGTDVTFTASLRNVPDAADVPITLTIAGPNSGALLARTNANGEATFIYTGKFSGIDQLNASATVKGSSLSSNRATVGWTPGKHTSFLSLNSSPGGGAPNSLLQLKAALLDASVRPAAPIAGASVMFDVAGQQCSAMTDAEGVASCSVTPTVAAGEYTLTANFVGSTTLLPASASKEVDLIIAPPHQLLNISTRARVGTGDNVTIGGFIITGLEPKRVIVRGIGPSLGASGVPGVLANPTLELFRGPDMIDSNDDWRSHEAEVQATGVAPTDDLESAIVRTLDPGAYTAILRGAHDGTGVGLVEVFDLTAIPAVKLANISTRSFVETGDNVLIGGFIAGPNDGSLVTVVVRAIGPSLSGLGVSNALQDPTITLYDATGNILGTNDNWRINQSGDSQAADIQATMLAPTDDRESAILIPLAPGGYTAIVRGKENSSGVGLVEIFSIR